MIVIMGAFLCCLSLQRLEEYGDIMCSLLKMFVAVKGGEGSPQILTRGILLGPAVFGTGLDVLILPFVTR